MVRTQPRPTLHAGARWHQGTLTSARRQADPARVVGNKSSATGLLGDAAALSDWHDPTSPWWQQEEVSDDRPA
jgi:hypothetical protein